MNAALLRTAALMTLVLTAAACTEGSDQAERPHEAPAVSPTGIGCPNEASAVATPRAESKGHLQGDVDGDGEEDEVFLIYERNARPGCRAFLILETEEQTFSAPIADWGDDAFVPELAFLTEVNGRRGREVIVKLGAGASVELFGMFTWQARELRRIDIRGWVHRGGFPIHDPSRDDLVVHGASAGHGDAVDCTRSNMVVISSAFPKKGGAGSNPYVIERRFYRPLPDAIVLARQDFAERPGTYAKDFFEFRSRPFQHCKSSKDLTS
ncbi:MAG: hypothetical protein ACRDH0_03815, partial [Actinomycetota bacterium]